MTRPVIGDAVLAAADLARAKRRLATLPRPAQSPRVLHVDGRWYVLTRYTVATSGAPVPQEATDVTEELEAMLDLLGRGR